jgi:hypothetical protein
MIDVPSPPPVAPTRNGAEPPGGDGQVAAGQTGASLFPELVWAHFRWEQQLHGRRTPDPTLDDDYRAKLEEFERAEGPIVSAYWSTYRASATALTDKNETGFLHRVLGEDDSVMRFHRVTDWATREAGPIADVLYRCDGLAIRVSQVLRGPSERIAMQLIAAVANHLLGFVDRKDGQPTKAEAGRVARDQTRELERIEAYYDRAGTKAGRIVYFWGMMAGVLSLLAIMTLLALFFWIISLWDKTHTPGLELFFAAFSAGAVGAVVSVLQRMSSRTGAFRIDYEVGRSAIVRLGSFRPLIGAVSGVAIYFLLAGGLLKTQPPDGDKAFFYYGSLAFLAGFSERWTNVMLGGAERMIGARSRGDGGGGVGLP